MAQGIRIEERKNRGCKGLVKASVSQRHLSIFQTLLIFTEGLLGMSIELQPHLPQYFGQI